MNYTASWKRTEHEFGAVWEALHTLIDPKNRQPAIVQRLAGELEGPSPVQARLSNTGSYPRNETNGSGGASLQSQRTDQEEVKGDKEEGYQVDNERQDGSKTRVRANIGSKVSLTRAPTSEGMGQSRAEHDNTSQINQQQFEAAGPRQYEQDDAELTNITHSQCEQGQCEQDNAPQDQSQAEYARKDQASQVPAMQLAQHHLNAAQVASIALAIKAQPMLPAKTTAPDTKKQPTVAPPSGPRVSLAPTSSVQTSQPQFNRSVAAQTPAVHSMHHHPNAAQVTTTTQRALKAQRASKAKITAAKIQKPATVAPSSVAPVSHAPTISVPIQPQIDLSAVPVPNLSKSSWRPGRAFWN